MHQRLLWFRYVLVVVVVVRGILSFFPFLCHIWLSTSVDFKFALILLLKHSDLLLKVLFKAASLLIAEC